MIDKLFETFKPSIDHGDKFTIADNELLMKAMAERALQAAKPNAGAEITERVIALVESSPVKA